MVINMKAAFLVNSKNRLTNIGNNQKVEIFDIQNGLIVPLKLYFFLTMIIYLKF